MAIRKSNVRLVGRVDEATGEVTMLDGSAPVRLVPRVVVEPVAEGEAFDASTFAGRVKSKHRRILDEVAAAEQNVRDAEKGAEQADALYARSATADNQRRSDDAHAQHLRVTRRLKALRSEAARFYAANIEGREADLERADAEWKAALRASVGPEVRHAREVARFEQIGKELAELFAAVAARDVEACEVLLQAKSTIESFELEPARFQLADMPNIDYAKIALAKALHSGVRAAAVNGVHPNEFLSWLYRFGA